MTQEQVDNLMKPRYKVIADYPRSCFNIGDILRVSGDCAGKGYTGSGVMPASVYKPELYPHLFRKLEWWEDRTPEEMPEYVKFYQPMPEMFKIGKVEKWELRRTRPIVTTDADRVRRELSDADLPSTEQEYLNYQQSKPKQ